MIDYHCHILPGMDDGPTSVDDSLAMAEQLSAAGFVEVYCTPHCIRGVYETTPEAVRQKVAELQEALDWYRVPLQLRPGMEYYIDEFFSEFLGNLQPLGDTRLILIEAPAQARLEQIAGGVFELTCRGYIPLIAHPERLKALAPPAERTVLSRLWQKFSAPADTAEAASPVAFLREMGCRFQGNLGSFVGYYGAEVRMRALQFLQAGEYHCYGSDGHAPEAMATYLDAGLDFLRDALTDLSSTAVAAASPAATDAGWQAGPSNPDVSPDNARVTDARRLSGQMDACSSAAPTLLCLYGVPGSGKTATLATIESALAHEEVLRTEAEAIVCDLPFSAEERAAFEQKYLLLGNLLVDDLQALADTPAMAKEFCRLVRDRQAAGRLTVIASELSQGEWMGRNSLVAEVLACGESIRLDGPR